LPVSCHNILATTEATFSHCYKELPQMIAGILPIYEEANFRHYSSYLVLNSATVATSDSGYSVQSSIYCWSAVQK